MDKYRLVGEKKGGIEGPGPGTAGGQEDGKSVDVCEVRITQQGKPRNYISYAMNLFVSGTSS